jgi:hypothetical protein
VITRIDEGDIEPFDTVRLDGRDSFAGAPGTFIPPPPDGYSWQLVQRPVGSTAVLSSTQNNTNELVVDLAGFYQVQLDVFAVDADRPDDGLIRSCAPATIDIDVVPEDDLHIQLVWDIRHCRFPEPVFNPSAWTISRHACSGCRASFRRRVPSC